VALVDSLPILLLIVACAFLFFRLQRALTTWALRELTEAGEPDSLLLIVLLRFFASPVLLLPLGVIALTMSALAYKGHVDMTIPWWLCAVLGLEAVAEGLDTLLRSRKTPR
jgi:hypothetical protein